MNELQIFKNPEFGEIRTVTIDNEPWLVGKDVAEALGYENPTKAIRDHVDDDDKKMGVQNVTPSIIDALGRTQYPTFINESGLYSLVMSSKLDGARRFKRWVTSEVLPSIRKHGAYMTGDTLDRMIASPEFGIRLLSELQEERKRRAALEDKVEADKPKVLFADAVATAKTSILVGELAKILKQNGVDIGQNRLFKRLRAEGYLISRKGTDYNMPTQRAMEMGLFEIKETSITHPDGHVSISKTPKVTGKGQSYFINRFLGRPEEV